MERVSRRPRAPTDPYREDDADAGTSLILRIGIVVAGGVVTCIIASIPAALRLGGEGSLGTLLTRWLILAGLSLPLAVASVAVLRRARVGARQLLGDRAGLLFMGITWWSVNELALLALVGTVLRKTTHHHALAGVFFAIFAVVSGVILGLLARRTTAMIARGGSGYQRFGHAAVSACAVVIVVLVLIRTGKAADLHAAAGLVDAISMALIALMTSGKAFTKTRVLAVIGLPLAIGLLVVGLTMLRFDPKLRGILPTGAPLHALVLDLFGH